MPKSGFNVIKDSESAREGVASGDFDDDIM